MPSPRALRTAVSAVVAAAVVAGALLVSPVEARADAFTTDARAYAGCPKSASNGTADALLAGTVELPNFAPVQIGTGTIDWNFNPYNHPTFASELNELVWLNPLIGRHRAADVSRLREVLQDYIANNDRAHPVSGIKWNNRDASLRAIVLACSGQFFSGEQWWQDAIVAYGTALADPTFYAGYWNYGLAEDVSLARLACLTGRSAWTSIAAARGARNVWTDVDSHGASAEQSIGYASYFRTLIGQYTAALALCGYAPPVSVATYAARLDDFITNGTRPDGVFAQLGDTTGGQAITTHPTATTAVYSAGYVFSRTAWNSSAGYYTLRFGPLRAVHGHDDHTQLTWWRNGLEWLIDSGHAGYRPGAYRDWLKSAAAHNVVTVYGATPVNTATALTNSSIAPTRQLFVLSDTPYTNFTRRRAVLHVSGPDDFFVVVDDMHHTRPTPVAYQQLWHLPETVTVRAGSGPTGTVATQAGRALHIIQANLARTVLLSGSATPMQGWRARSTDEKQAAPTVVGTQRGVDGHFVTVLTDTSASRPVVARWIAVNGHRRLRIVIGATNYDIGIGALGPVLATS